MFARYPFLKSPPKMTLPALALIMLLSVIPSLSFAERGEAYEYLYEAMDRYHKKFYVYTNKDEGGNHFYPSGFMGNIRSIDINTNWVSDPYEGTSCIRVVFTAGDDPRAGLYWQEPENNWGTIPNAGYDLTGATEISFFAKGEKGGEKVEFFVGGIDGKHPDSLSNKISTDIGIISLESGWREYKIDLTSKDLTHVIGGFGFVLQSTDNPNGATFYIDNIGYNKSRLDDLRFLLSFQSIQSIDDPDRRLTNACFVYDNAVALLSFLARGTTEDLRKAKLLADAFIYAQDNDRYYKDGRLRNAYMSADLIDHLTRKARIPGWWDTTQKKWMEEPSQITTDTGGVAWVIIALLSYYKKAGGQQYLQAAETLGEWIENKTYDHRCDGGYKGGFQGEGANVQQIEWKSTEHNIDIYVAFTLLHKMTKNSDWKNRAMHAKRFVDAMWNDANSHFWSGTADDGCSIDYDMGIHVDIQAWAPMALGNYNSALIGAESNCYTETDGFKGFDFNNDKDGVWF